MNNILFDLDGTITDSGEGIINSTRYALNELGVDISEGENLQKFIGPPLKDSFKKFYHFDEKKAKEGLIKFREYFEKYGMFENNLYYGIEEVLKKIKEEGKNIILATSKPEVYARKILKHFKLDRYFDIIAGSDFEETRVKKEDVIKYALNELQEIVNESIDLKDCIMIGDREYDIIGAKKNGIKCIGVLYGYGNIAELTKVNADFLIKKPEDILEILK